jgi:hypothetical protein
MVWLSSLPISFERLRRTVELFLQGIGYKHQHFLCSVGMAEWLRRQT